jgi:hypothetical protein
MKRDTAIVAAAVVFMLAVARSKIFACAWAIDYFYQVTNLRGTVVGSDFSFLHSFRWHRQSVVRPDAKLRLYEFRWPCDAVSRATLKTVFTDSGGKFDFGVLQPGHYYLKIDDEKGSLSALFQIEVRGAQNPKESEIIDISSVSPDCTAGHEFTLKVN